MKTCTKCRKTKELSDFNKRKESPDGYRAACKLCHKLSRGGEVHRLKGQTEIPEDKKTQVYLEAILRMKESGIASDRTAQEMAIRVGAL